MVDPSIAPSLHRAMTPSVDLRRALLFIVPYWRRLALVMVLCLASTAVSLYLQIALEWDSDRPRDFAYIMLVTVGVTTFAWLAVTWMTRPEPDATLQAFYRRVRPQGPGWKPVAASVGPIVIPGWPCTCFNASCARAPLPRGRPRRPVAVPALEAPNRLAAVVAPRAPVVAARRVRVPIGLDAEATDGEGRFAATASRRLSSEVVDAPNWVVSAFLPQDLFGPA